jgi:eukaryotic-like serine/threonine-protein kinase
VGATMFTLLSGKLVHEAPTAQRMLVDAMIKPARSLAKVAPNRPRAVIQLIDRALAFDKKDRWPDAKTMQQAVRVAHQSVLGRPMVTASMLRTTGPDRPAPADPLARTVRVDSAPNAEPTTVAPVSSTPERASGRRALRLGLYGGALLVGLVGAGLVVRSQLVSRGSSGTEPPAGASGTQTAASNPHPSAMAPSAEPTGETSAVAPEEPGPSSGTAGSLSPTVPPPSARPTASAQAAADATTAAAPVAHAPSVPTTTAARSAAPSAGPKATDPEALKDRRK